MRVSFCEKKGSPLQSHEIRCARSGLFERRTFQDGCPARTAGKGSQLPLPIPPLMGEDGTAVPSGFVYETSSPRDPLTIPGLKRGPRCVSRNMQKRSRWDLFRPHGGDQNAHIHGRAFGQPKIFGHHRAHVQIQVGHAARTVRSKIIRVVSILSGFTLFRISHGKVLPPTHICAF